MRWHGAALLVAFAVTFLLAGCSHYDYQLYVENHTGTTYLFRLPWGPPHEDWVQVHRVAPGRSGLAGFWLGDPETVIELLDQDCRVVASFERTTSGSSTIDGLPGVTAVIQLRDTRAQDSTYPEEIGLTEDCGGYERSCLHLITVAISLARSRSVPQRLARNA